MKRSLATLFGAFALPLALACSDSAPTAPEADLETISESELLGAFHDAGLTDEQRAGVRAALQAARQEIEAIRARLRSGEITIEEARALVRRVHESLLETLSTILTPEQLEELHRPPHRPGPPPAPMFTEEQMTQILALRQELAAFVESLRVRVRSGELTGEEAREQLRQAVQRFNAAVCSILTAEQQARAHFCRAAGG